MMTFEIINKVKGFRVNPISLSSLDQIMGSMLFFF